MINIANFQRLADHKKNEESREFMKAMTLGLIDIKERSELTLAEVKKKLNMI